MTEVATVDADILKQKDSGALSEPIERARQFWRDFEQESGQVDFAHSPTIHTSRDGGVMLIWFSVRGQHTIRFEPGREKIFKGLKPYNKEARFTYCTYLQALRGAWRAATLDQRGKVRL